MIKIHETIISDCLISEYDQFHDHRGYFSEIFKSSSLPHFKPLQTNISFSKKGVLRGIHRTPYAKLVSCVHGSVFDVCVDLRKDSKTYGEHVSVELSSNNHNSIYIPSYCGHGFLALTDSILVYHQNNEYNKLNDQTFCYQNFNIDWPNIDQIIISDKDKLVCYKEI